MASIDDLVSNIKNGVQAIGSLNTSIQTIFPQQTGTAATATGGAATLPGNPVGFIVVSLPNGGGTAKIPYYGV